MRASFVLIALLLLGGFCIPAPQLAAEQGIWLTDELQLKLAEAFMDERDYQRAITEYKKFLILFPGSNRTDYVLFGMGMAYYHNEEYGASIRALEGLREKFPESGYAPEARYVEGLSYRQLGQPENAKIAFEGIAVGYPDSEHAPLALVAIVMLALEQDHVNSGRQALETLATAYPDHPRVQRMRETAGLFAQYHNLPQKSEVLAGVLSAVVPGTGYIYAKHYGDGITAFLINALSIVGTVTAIGHENYAVAGIAGGIGLPFYFGNIYGSANAAKKWNLAVKKEMRNKIAISLDFSF